MMDIIKADIQRIFRGKGIYITLIVLLILSVMLVISADFIFDVIAGEELAIDGVATSFNNADITLFMMESANNLFYLILPLIVFVISSDFSSGMVKNLLSSGTSREKYYFSKLILTSLFSILVYVSYMIISLIGIGLLRGFEGALDINVVKALFAQLFIILAVNCLGVFLAFTTKKMAATIGFYIAFLMGTSLIATIIVLVSETSTKLVGLDLGMNFVALANITGLSLGEAVAYLLIGAGYILFSVIGGLLLFRKSEIK